MNQNIIRVIQHKFTLPIATAVVSGASFGIGGYILGRRAGTRLLSDETQDNEVSEEAETEHAKKTNARFDATKVSDNNLRRETAFAQRNLPPGHKDKQWSSGRVGPDNYNIQRSGSGYKDRTTGNNRMFDLDEPLGDGVGFSDEPLYDELELDWDAELSIEDQELYDASMSPSSYNVFEKNKKDDAERYENSLTEWNMELELSTRNGREPYVIHFDEFAENDETEGGLVQKTLTYYEGDDIMTDEHDTPIYQYHTVTGALKFGHGSKDSNVVYIRNEELQLEVEVLYMPGRYEVEVLGLDDKETVVEGQIRHARAKRMARESEE